MISEIEQETNDFNWFFTDGTNIGFAASGGGKLPLTISSSRIKFDLVSIYFNTRSRICDTVINPKLSTLYIDDEMYLKCFIEFAEKGLFAFDKTMPNNFSDTAFHLVAIPTNPLTIEDLPINIHKILNETHFKQPINLDFDLRQLGMI